MADPLSVTAGVIQVAAFALEGVSVLYNTIQSYKHSSKIIQSLSDELEALSEVLKFLEAASEDDIALPSLKLPLQRCGTVCRDFQKLMSKIVQKDGQSRQKFRSWMRLQSNGQDIRMFKESLEIWKSTICIALGDANLRHFVVTSQVLRDYKQMIASTSDKLEMRLESLDDNLESLSSLPSADSSAVGERIPLQQERDSTTKCLDVCAQVLNHVSAAQHNVLENISTSTDAIQTPVTTLIGLISAGQATNDALKVCENTLSRTSSWLQRQLQNVDTSLQSLSSESGIAPSEGERCRGSLEADVESTKSAIAVMAKASETANGDRINVYEDVATAEDSNQYIVSTIGDLISAKRVTAGARSAQVMGQLSEANFESAIEKLTRHNMGTGSATQSEGAGNAFGGRYGTGYRISRKDSVGTGANWPRETAQ